MKIESAEVTGDVDDFADEEQSADFTGFHGFAGQFGRVHTAGGDFGFVVAFGTGGMDGPGMEFPFECIKSGVGKGFRRVELEPALDEAFRKEYVEGFFGDGEVACPGYADCRGELAVGSKIDLHRSAITPVTGGLEDGGAAQATMREKHFFAKRVFVGNHGNFGGNSSEVGIALAVAGVEQERDKGGACGNDVQPEFAGKVIAKGGGSHFGDRETACCNDENGRAILGDVATDNKRGVTGDFANLGIDDDFCLGGTTFGLEHRYDLRGGMVAEELAERFLVIRDAVFFDQGDEVCRSVASQRGFGEVRIGGEELFRPAVEIGEIAAASTGNEDFFADFFGAFQKEHAAAAFSGFDRAKKTGGTGTENNDVEIGQRLPFAQLGRRVVPAVDAKIGHCGRLFVYTASTGYSTSRRVRRAPQG